MKTRINLTDNKLYFNMYKPFEKNIHNKNYFVYNGDIDGNFMVLHRFGACHK